MTARNAVGPGPGARYEHVRSLGAPPRAGDEVVASVDARTPGLNDPQVEMVATRSSTTS